MNKSLAILTCLVILTGCTESAQDSPSELMELNLDSDGTYTSSSGERYAIIYHRIEKQFEVIPYTKPKGSSGSVIENYTDNGAYFKMHQPAERVLVDNKSGRPLDASNKELLQQTTTNSTQRLNGTLLALKELYPLTESDVNVSFHKHLSKDIFIKVDFADDSIGCRVGDRLGLDGHCWPEVDDRVCGNNAELRLREAEEDSLYTAICLETELRPRTASECYYAANQAYAGIVTHDAVQTDVEWTCQTPVKLKLLRNSEHEL